MKNILLTTTALATLLTGVASAYVEKSIEKPMKDSKGLTVSVGSKGLTVSVGGSFEAQAGARSQKKAYTTATDDAKNSYVQGITPGNKNVGFDTVAAIHATVKNKTAEGTTYGAQIGVLATTQGQKSAGKSSLDRTFLFVENDSMGRFEVGSQDGVANKMRTGADNVARATGGVDGDWSNYVVLKNLNNDNFLNFIQSPTTYLTNYQMSGSEVVRGDEKSRKINYYTPVYNGFQVGLTYTPDARNSGQDKIFELNQKGYKDPTAKNAISGGVSWTGKFKKNQSLEVSVVGETSTMQVSPADKAAGNKYHNARSMIVGAQYGYEDFSLAASYGNQGKSGFAKNTPGLKGGSFWTLGAAYVQGPIAASVTYMNSKLNKNTMDLISLGVDYQVAPGLLPYVEVTYFSAKGKNKYTAPVTANLNANPPTTATPADNLPGAYKNKGTAFILGTRLTF